MPERPRIHAVLPDVRSEDVLPELVDVLEALNLSVGGARVFESSSWSDPKTLKHQPIGKVSLQVEDEELTLRTQGGDVLIYWAAAPSLELAVQLAERLRADHPELVLEADFPRERFGSLPKPPLANYFFVLAMPRERVLERYPDVEAFAAAWDAVTEDGDSLLLTRGLQADDLEAALFPGNWHLARVTTGAGTHYGFRLRPRTDGAQALVEGQTDRLVRESVREGDGVHVFSARCGPGQHLSARDVFSVARLLRDEEDDRGRPVRGVEVRFPDQASARAEARPLLDVGAEVRYLDDQGDAARLVDEEE